MATYTINIDDAIFNQLLEAFAASYGYQPIVKNEAGEDIEVSKADFMRQCTAAFWKDVLTSHVRSQALKAAEASLPNLNVTINI